jgi:hypothetical protein
MPYIAKQPGTAFRTFTDKDTFSGDGSTTTFDMQFAIAEAGQNDLQIFVGGTLQIPGTDFTLGVDGAGDYKRITFTSAPASASNNIVILNPGTVEGELATVADNAITSGKLNVDAITGQTELAEQAADGDEYLIHDTSAGTLKRIAASNVTPNETLITGKDEITVGNVAGDDVLLIYDTSAGVLKKITKNAFDALQPVFSSATPTNLLSGDGTGNYTIVIAGTDFDVAATFKLVTDGGTDIAMDTVTRDSSVQLTGVVAKSTANLTSANEPFDITVTNGNGLAVTSANAVTIDAQPAWVTASGSLGTVGNASRGSDSFTVEATDPESGAITINTTLVSGSLPAGSSLVDNADGTATISGFSAVGSNTTSTFTLRAADASSNTTDRQYSITVNAPITQSFTSSGTYSVPSGVTAVDVLVVGGGGAGGSTYHGGGGGAGGLVYRPGFPVTPGGTVSVTVGSGGTYPSPGSGDTPGTIAAQNGPGDDSVFGTLTAKGGGRGGSNGNTAGSQSGGGSGGGEGQARGGAGPANQPTQSGESGNYGFGNPGGTTNPSGSWTSGGGGGGAGGAGGSVSQAGPGNANTGLSAGPGGVGKAYTIADGTTSVYYAGGGGGSAPRGPAASSGGQGGGGGGYHVAGQNGTANRGGGGGGSERNYPGNSFYPGGSGGKGIVIVSY